MVALFVFMPFVIHRSFGLDQNGVDKPQSNTVHWVTLFLLLPANLLVTKT